jgi:hypothetical protein
VLEIPAMPSELQKLKDQFADLPLREAVDGAMRTLASVDLLSRRLDGRLDVLTDEAKQISAAAIDALSEISHTARELSSMLQDGRREIRLRGGGGADPAALDQ